ncbi:hypothetical protein [Nocardia sp. NPDC050406]|uniref:hypothetical protein n=1 Tax=Nocardia sp. NPDC050406 TaxID=3364318 RepID=UPI0037BA6E85
MIYFSMGYWVLALAAIVSASGAAVGLACIRQSTKSVTARFRYVWLFVAGCSIGGVGVAMPIFVLLLGVGAKGSQIRYDNTSIILFSTLSGMTVLAALIVVGRTLNTVRLAVGTAIMATGLGSIEVLMLAAMRVQGSVNHNPLAYIAVYAIAILVSAATLWFSLTVRSQFLLAGGAMLYALAVIGMTYSGLAGLSFDIDPAAAAPPGVDLFTWFVPTFIIGTLSLAVPITAILVAPDRREANLVPAMSQPGSAPRTPTPAERHPESTETRVPLLTHDSMMR